MTPKEKAEKLLDFYYYNENLITHFKRIQSKKVASSAVDQIMNALDKNCGGWDFNYWEEVKQEIEKL